MRFFFLSVFILLLSLSACGKKDTIINGRVTDAKTSAPIKGAKITYSPYVPSDPQQGTFDILTDIEGKFHILLSNEVEGFSGFTIQKINYVPKFRLEPAFIKHEMNDIEIIMHPRDATLRLIYENGSSIEKKIYLQAQSKTFTEEYGILPYIITQPYPFVCQPNNKDTVNYSFTSDEQINLYWAFSYYEKASQSTFKDSLYLSRGDTATYSITF